MKSQKKPEYIYIYTAAEVGQRTGLSPESLRQYAKRYHIGEKRGGREIRYSERCIEIILAHIKQGRGRPRKQA